MDMQNFHSKIIFLRHILFYKINTFALLINDIAEAQAKMSLSTIILI